jgi:hypothetical protein
MMQSEIFGTKYGALYLVLCSLIGQSTYHRVALSPRRLSPRRPISASPYRRVAYRRVAYRRVALSR